jgi:cytochrome c5
MKQDPKKDRHFISLQNAVVLSIVIFFIAVGASAFKKDLPLKEIRMSSINADSIESVKAFETVYKTLMSPRCMNCHPAGDVPLQGDDSHLHTMNPKRGAEGKGVYAMKCSNCHQETNTPGLHTPPGNPEWHLPPAAMKMVFQGKSAHELAKQLVDKKKNGNKDIRKLIEHADDGLVLAGWNPGEGRTLPPVTHAEFKKAWITWLKTGAYAPRK